MSVHIAGQLDCWPAKERLAEILHDSGLRVHVGWYSIRVEGCSHFVFQQYGGDLGDPIIDAGADTAEELMLDGRLVSDALTLAGIRHKFELYDERNELCCYLHHNWPIDPPDPSL